MPFTDPVSSISGRNSRASNVSAATGASRSLRSPPPMGAGADALANAGVLSMLKTSTDTGDIGALSFNSTRLPSMPYRSGQRRQQPSKTSTSSHPYPGGSNSHHYAASVTSRVSSATRDWETGSNGRRGSMTSMQTMPTFVSDTQPSVMSHPGRPMGLGPIPSSGNRHDSRSYSLTNAVASSQLPRHKSATSLKSQGHEPRRYDGQPPPMPEIRPPPYVYPTRLKRPGYRSPSPAQSETYAQAQPPPIPLQNAHRRQQVPPVPPMPRPAMPTYHSDYGQGYPVDPAHLNVPPPPRAMPNSSMMPYEQMPPSQPPFNYRPGPMKPSPAVVMQHPGQRMPPPPHHPQQHPYGPPRPVYAPNGYVLQPQQRRGPPPSPNVGPVAHHIFHNAARLARQLPQRTDTPMTEAGAPSSDPPSSGTAPTTSSPPTPKDQTTIQVAVDPAFIDPALTDLPESTSDPVIPAKYFDYIDGLEKAAEDSEIEAHHASVPPSGFVQRVKAMLESRAAADAAAKREAEREHERGQGERLIEHAGIYELAAPEIERVTIIEEFNAPVELPASPVIVAEMPASPVKSMRRLTRDMVKAELALSTTGVEQSSKYANAETPSPLKPNETIPNEEEQEPFEPSTLNDDTAEDTPLPSSPPELQHKGSVTDSVPSSDGSHKVDGMDFAVHFSPPSETEATATDLGETETESRDPFALDADTITAQHKGGKETPSSPDLDESPHAPVSPLLPGETVDRFSAVSPIHEETAGIDETMMALRDDSSPLDHRPRRSHRYAANDESLAPPTPRTPRSYSKSVQLPHPTDTPTNSNRLSLPADLSQIGETTVNSTDAMTDVAVRFSLPQNTVTLAKPQIVQIASSTPPKDEPAPLKSAIHAPERQRRHGSVTFEDEVPPLKVNKKTDQHRQSQSLGAIALRARPQPSRGPSPFEAQSDSDRGSQDTTTDLRFSGINFIRNKYPSTHLPGLKEESSEDMSVTTHRQSTDIANGLQFQLPARIAAVKAMQERRQQELQDKEKMREARNRPHPDDGRPLGETRDLPSLNFSRMDLIDKLNEALQVRTRNSLEVVRRRDFSAIYHPSPQRPQSTDPALWDRYTSFFNKPEDFPEELEDEEQPSGDEAEDAGDESKPSSRRHSKNASEGDADSAKRPLSPEERMLNVATQVNRLSIPSVNGLSERLSELLPNLRDLNLDTVLANDQQIAHTIDDIHQLGKIPGARPDTVLSTRTSAGFRTLAERAEEIVKNGTHDSVIPLKAMGLNKDLPPLPGSASLDKVSAQSPVDGRSSYLSGSISAPSELTNQLQRPASALIRGKSPLTEDEVQRLLPPEMNPIARGSKRSLVVSSLSSRPWNLDENYPWARSNLHIDLVAPDQVHARETLAAELARHRGTKSLDCTLTGDLLGNTTSGIDIGSITTDLDPTASVTTLQLTGVSTQHVRKHSKRSMLGSIKHKIGLSRSHHDDTTRSLPTSPGLRTADEPAHNPGDRYPTTALTPPVAFNLDEVRSYFSDDSSESNKERKTPKGRRWTGLKSKASKANTNHNNPDPTRGAQSLDEASAANPHPYDAASLAADRTALDSSAAFTLDGIGMGKAEFRIKRLGEKLRVWFAKGGELFRSLSLRSARSRKAAAARERERDEWLSDSLYSGV
ncbi:hypothetical protein WHR41_04288 [Cladosporium halotolerans]|uniref:Uncharacterized protein n=1 Tax=Cladosporium halotolerans TaxID=1052096 RepID=A0AB34KPL3_9PEZI